MTPNKPAPVPPSFASRLAAEAADLRRAVRTNLRELACDWAFEANGVLVDGCAHRHLAWPQDGEQVCLDCAHRWRYDWRRMRRGARVCQPCLQAPVRGVPQVRSQPPVAPSGRVVATPVHRAQPPASSYLPHHG